MDVILLDYIQAEVTKEDVLRKFGMPPDHKLGPDIEKAIEEVKPIANAKLLYGESKVEIRTEDTLSIGGITFEGKDLVEALKNVDIVYPYICTCGRELNDYAMNCKDMVRMLYYDYIAHFYLLQSSIELSKIVDNKLGTRSTCMTPGSFEHWEISQNLPIFKLLNYGKGTGIDLSTSYIMYPAKSVAGLRFKTSDCGKRCSLCLKNDCADRLSDFKKEDYENTLC